MINDVFRESFEWAFSLFSDIWPILLLPFVLFCLVTCFKSVCGLSGCRSVRQKDSALAADSGSVADSDCLYICSGCDDCPMFCKRDKCGLSGTAFCSIGKWVTKGGKLV